MSCYNNERNLKRIRHKSCPAGVRFEINDIKTGDHELEREKHVNLTKVVNIVDERRPSLPSGTYNEEIFTDDEQRAGHLANYSIRAGGVHNSFHCKLNRNINIFHSSTSHQHKNSNKSDVKKAFHSVESVPSNSATNHIQGGTLDSGNYEHLGFSAFDAATTIKTKASQCNKSLSTLPLEDVSCKQFLPSVEERKQQTSLISLISENEPRTFELNLNREILELDIVKVSDQEDNLVRLLDESKQVRNTGEFDNDVKRLECHVYGTELLVESLASQVEETNKELTMSKKKQESELSDLLLLNEEMQTMWSEKESEVREMLERFSAYRMAVEADSKEKEEIYTDELFKRETFIKELEFSKNELEEKLSKKDTTLGKLVSDVQEVESTRLEQFLAISKLVDELEVENYTQEGCEVNTKREKISVCLQSVIKDLKDNNINRDTASLQVPEQQGCFASDMILNGKIDDLEESQGVTTDYDPLAAQFLTEGKQKNKAGDMDDKPRFDNGGFVLPEEEKQLVFSPRSNYNHEGIVTGDVELYEHTGNEFEREVVYTDETLCYKTETLEEDLAMLVKRLEENGNEADEEEDGEGSIERKIFVNVLKEQWSRCQVLCKEKQDEIQYLIKKHKQDTKNLQDVLEEQERSEVKNNETLAELQVEVDKLRQRNKFLESEVEIIKEENEDEVFVLRENLKKDLNEQLRRQSTTFLSSEEASRNQLVELDQKNEELRRTNDDLRQQIAEHCSEIKSWVSGILLLSEEEYNEEFHTISDVLAKLQKIILENKRMIEELQDQIREENVISDDPLSHSWGGHSWNSADSQKELCYNCRQKKWRRVLMGSYDLVEAGMEVKQDDIDTFVEKIDANEAKYRKKQSLKDSLELAELRERLGEEKWNTLDTLGEYSLEGHLSGTGDGSNIPGGNEDNNIKMSSSEVAGSEDDSHNDQFDLPAYSYCVQEKVGGYEENGLEDKVDGWEDGVGGVEEEKDGSKEVDKFGGGEIQGEKGENCDKRRMVAVDSDAMEEVEAEEKHRSLIFSAKTEKEEKEDDDGVMDEEEDDDCDDVVRVVNLYRSLIDYNPCILSNDKTSNNRETNKYLMGCSESIDSDNDSNDKSYDACDYGDDNGSGLSKHGDYGHDNGSGLSKHGDCGDDNGSGLSKHGDCDITQIQDTMEPYGTTEQDIPSDPVLTSKKDVNDNFPEDGVKNDMRNDPTRIESNIEVPNNQKNGECMNSDITRDESVLEIKAKSDDVRVLEQEAYELSTSAMSCVSSEKSLGKFVEKMKENNTCAGLCSHCSDILLKNAAGYEKTIEKLLDLKSQREKDEETRILRTLHETKEDVLRYQQQYEDLEKVCEDYHKRIDEYSDNIRNKNMELRKLQLRSNVMKTEVVWLRQALGITRDYGESKVDF